MSQILQPVYVYFMNVQGHLERCIKECSQNLDAVWNKWPSKQ